MTEDRGPLPGRCRPSPSEILPGDWLEIAFDGKTLVGMVYVIHGDVYTLAYWEGCNLRFGTALYGEMGPRDEQLTALFRAQLAIDPFYVEKLVAPWLPRDDSFCERSAPPREPAPPPRKVQKRLFPE